MSVDKLSKWYECSLFDKDVFEQSKNSFLIQDSSFVTNASQFHHNLYENFFKMMQSKKFAAN